jgi:hypothetical protein
MIQFCRLALRPINIPLDFAHFAFYLGLPEFNEQSAAVLDEAESVIVEICTGKSYSAFGYALSTKEIYRHLVEPAGDAGRAWWKNLHSGQQPTAELVRSVEAVLSPASLPNGKTLRALIGEIKFREITVDELVAGLSTLHDLLRRPILIVPHVSVRLPNGDYLKERAKHVANTIEAARRLGFPVFDPKVLIDRDGQHRVLAKAGTDFHHYEKEPLAVVGHEMINAFDACLVEHVGGN